MSKKIDRYYIKSSYNYYSMPRKISRLEALKKIKRIYENLTVANAALDQSNKEKPIQIEHNKIWRVGK